MCYSKRIKDNENEKSLFSRTREVARCGNGSDSGCAGIVAGCIAGHSAAGVPILNSAGVTQRKNVAREETTQRGTDDTMGSEEEKMSEKWQLNIMTAALAIGIILVWITWDPVIVIGCMVLSVIRLAFLFWEYPEMVGFDADEYER